MRGSNKYVCLLSCSKPIYKSMEECLKRSRLLEKFDILCTYAVLVSFASKKIL